MSSWTANHDTHLHPTHPATPFPRPGWSRPLHSPRRKATTQPTHHRPQQLTPTPNSGGQSDRGPSERRPNPIELCAHRQVAQERRPHVSLCAPVCISVLPWAQCPRDREGRGGGGCPMRHLSRKEGSRPRPASLGCPGPVRVSSRVGTAQGLLEHPIRETRGRGERAGTSLLSSPWLFLRCSSLSGEMLRLLVGTHRWVGCHAMARAVALCSYPGEVRWARCQTHGPTAMHVWRRPPPPLFRDTWALPDLGTPVTNSITRSRGAIRKDLLP